MRHWTDTVPAWVLADIDRELNQALMALSPRDYEAAVALAKKLLAENDNCCLFSLPASGN